MNIRIAILLVSISAVASCSDSDECSSGSFPFVGCWQAEGCEQLTDQNDLLVSKWAMTRYELTESGEVNFNTYIYDDASCTNLDETKYVKGSDFGISFNAGEAGTSEGGLPNQDLEFTLTRESDDSYTVISTITYVNSTRMCADTSVSFSPTGLGASEAGFDLELSDNCMVKVNAL